MANALENSADFIVGEYPRTLDERYRVSVPAELADLLLREGDECVLAKERPGCLSLWNATQWREKLDSGVNLVKQKIKAGKLEGKVEQVQLLGRLLSTRHTEVKFAGRGRLLIPEGFREFLGVEPGGDLLVIGAAVCVEFWRPAAWLTYLDEQIPEFRKLFDELSS